MNPEMDGLSARMQASLREREQGDALRGLSGLGQGVDFSSNDYLGLAYGGHLARSIAHRLGAALDSGDHQAGAGGSRLLTGNYPLVEELEEQIAQFHGAEAALFFSSGYAANTGLISTVAGRGDTILYDRLVHASTHEGMRLSAAKRIAFTHNDMDSLAGLAEQTTGQVFVLCESFYSMDGDQAPLVQMAELCARHSWHLIVDEAHAGGVAGDHGQGLVSALGIEELVFSRIITYGKAFGASGGAVLGSSLLRNFLINYCRAFIYSTGPIPAQVVAVQEAYRLVREAHSARSQISLLRTLLLEALPENFRAGFGSEDTDGLNRSAVIPIPCSGNEAVVNLSHQLAAKGYNVRAIRSPSVPHGAERLRCCLHAYNTAAEVHGLAEVLKTI